MAERSASRPLVSAPVGCIPQVVDEPALLDAVGHTLRREGDEVDVML